MSVFDIALAHTLLWEKGKVNHPKDPGGLTNLGMTQKLWDAIHSKHDMLIHYPVSVMELNATQVGTAFSMEFWNPCHCEDLHPALAIAVFDAAVNSGAGDARRWLQQALRVKVDGWIGPGTIAAARSCDLKATLTEFHSFRAWHYMLQDGIDDDFGLGWSRRLFDTHNVAVGLILPTGDRS